MTLVVHVHHVRRHVVQVVVQGGDFEALVKQVLHHGVDFFVQQHQVAHDHRAVIELLEGRVGAEGEAGLHGHAIDGHLQIGARHAHAKDVAWHHRAGPAQRILDGVPIDVGGLPSRSTNSCGATGHKHRCNRYECDT